MSCKILESNEENHNMVNKEIDTRLSHWELKQ